MQYQGIADEIRHMAEEDQAMRQASRNDPIKFDIGLDLRNTERMKQIVREIGWPTISRVGTNASHMAWLLVQHADHDVEFQKECLEHMRQVGKREAFKNAYEYAA